MIHFFKTVSDSPKRALFFLITKLDASYLEKSRRFAILFYLWVALLSGVFLSGCDSNEKLPQSQEVVSEINTVFPGALLREIHPGYAQIHNRQKELVGYALYNTAQELGSKGFRGPVPALVLCDSNDRVVHVAMLSNQEDASYLKKVQTASITDEWCGFPAKEAAELPVDTVTGATRTSHALIQSVQKILKSHFTKN